MKINIYDIAKEADTSISTVSRYLNNKNVRPETKKRIEEVIAKYNYKPSAIAKGLVAHSLKTVAVFVVDIRMPHYANAAYYIDKKLAINGYRTIICNTRGELTSIVKYIEEVSSQVDGIIFIGSIFNEINRFPDILANINNIPVVITNGKLDVNRCKPIYVDDQKGIYDATKCLINKGRKNIAYIQYSNNTSALKKAEGYKQAMQEANYSANIYHTNDLFGGYEVTQKLIIDNKNIDGVISGEDLIAIGAIRALENAGIKVGKDCDVIGFNDSRYCELSNPTLTAIDNKIEESSLAAADSLKDMIENEETDCEPLIFNCELKIKESA